MNAIECEHLTRSFGRTRAVDDLSLTVPAGSIFALLGANGAGKSTTLKILLNILRPTSGIARVLGYESTRLKKDIFQRIGYVTEDQALHDWMTVDQILNYYRPFYPKWDTALEKRLRVMFELPGDRALKKLSRGMRMKGAFLTVLPFRPEHRTRQREVMFHERHSLSSVSSADGIDPEWIGNAEIELVGNQFIGMTKASLSLDRMIMPDTSADR